LFIFSKTNKFYSPPLLFVTSKVEMVVWANCMHHRLGSNPARVGNSFLHVKVKHLSTQLILKMKESEE